MGHHARYILARWVGSMIDARFSLAFGLIGGLLADRAVPHADAIRLALGVGVCGGFTTSSTGTVAAKSWFQRGGRTP